MKGNRKKETLKGCKKSNKKKYHMAKMKNEKKGKIKKKGISQRIKGYQHNKGNTVVYQCSIVF